MPVNFLDRHRERTLKSVKNKHEKQQLLTVAYPSLGAGQLRRPPGPPDSPCIYMRWPPLRAQEVSRPTQQQDTHFLHKPDTFPLDTHRLSRRTGLDLVCHLAMTCTNTEKQLFTMDYTLSVPNNALDHRGHQMGARYGDRPGGGGRAPQHACGPCICMQGWCAI